MGRGVSDAALLLRNVETEGTAITLPNVYVTAGSSRLIDVMRCFRDGENVSFSSASDDTSIATVAVNGHNVTITGIAVGTTSFSVITDSGEKQTAYITVRKNAGDNGWL